MKEVTLPSGAILKIGRVPFDAANNLKKSVVGIMKSIPFVKEREALDLYKEHLCAIFSNEEIEQKLWVCMERCTYNDFKITKQTFDPDEARADFTDVQVEVGIACLAPFGNALWQLLQRVLSTAEGASQKQKS